MVSTHTLITIAAAAIAATAAGLAGASSASGLDNPSLIARQNMGSQSVAVDKDMTVSMSLGTPPQQIQSRLMLRSPWLEVADRTACPHCSDTKSYFDPSKSKTYKKKTDQWSPQNDGRPRDFYEDTMALAGFKYDQVPFLYVDKEPIIDGFIISHNAAYMGLAFVATSVVGNRSLPQPWWVSLEPEKLVGLDVARRIASAPEHLSTDFGRISFGEIDQSLINGSVTYHPIATQYDLYGQVNPDGLWAVTLDTVRVNGQDVVTRHNVSVKTMGNASTVREPFEKPTMVLSTELSRIELPNETFDAMLELIPGAIPNASYTSVPCNTTATISFVISGVEYPLHPSDWVEKGSTDDVCKLSIKAGDTQRNAYQLGTQFLGTVYTVLKLAPTPQVGFAQKSAPGPTPGTPATLTDPGKNSAVATGRPTLSTVQALGALLVAGFCGVF